MATDDPTRLIYLDNAATTFPKPPQVIREMLDIYARLGVSPGRGGYDLASECEQYVDEVRREINTFFGGAVPDRVVFAGNATDALNTIILGLIQPGCHVVSSRLEHNSVLRPLHHLRDQGLISFDLVPFDAKGFIDPEDVAKALKPKTSFVALNHVSNVLGTIQPISEVGRICAEHDTPLVLDVSQSAGVVPINMREMHVQAVAFTGHKSLLGPTGIGGLILQEDLDVRATRFGGTGFESWGMLQPEDFPYRLESGTINVLGIIGLAAGLRYINKRGIETVYKKEMSLARSLLDGLSSINGVRLYCVESLENHVAVLTMNMENLDPGDLASILDGDYGIATRSGLHCAPLVHKDLGTSPRGGVRFSLGPSNSFDDISVALSAIRAIAAG